MVCLETGLSIWKPYHRWKYKRKVFLFFLLSKTVALNLTSKSLFLQVIPLASSQIPAKLTKRWRSGQTSAANSLEVKGQLPRLKSMMHLLPITDKGTRPFSGQIRAPVWGTSLVPGSPYTVGSGHFLWAVCHEVGYLTLSHLLLLYKIRITMVTTIR